MMQAVIRVAALDDHPAVLAGLHRLIARTPDLVPTAFVDTQDALWRALDGYAADVVVVDLSLDRGDGLAVCLRLKERVQAPRVLIYSAYVGPALAVAARVAGVDGVAAKSDPVIDLLSAIRCVARGDTALPDIDPGLRRAAIGRLEGDDVAVASMLLAGASHDGIAETLGLGRREVARRARRIVGRVRPDTPVPGATAGLSPPGDGLRPFT